MLDHKPAHSADDPRRTVGPNAGHLPQARGLLLNQIEHRLSERPHQPLGVE